MKNLARLKVAVSLASVSVLAFVFVQACGGDDSNTGDGGLDGTTNDVVVADTSTNDVKTDSPGTDSGGDGGGACPTYTGSQPLCTAVLAHCGACGEGALNLTACQLANFTAVCDKEATAVSAAVAAAESTCASICDSTGFSNCGNGALAEAGLTAAQTKAATDYCARCGGASVGCAATIEKKLNIVEISDTVSGQIDTLCTPDASAAPDSSTCQGTYSFCAAAVFENALLGGPCSDAGGGG